MTIDSSKSKPVNDVDDSEAAAVKDPSDAHVIINSFSTEQENEKTADDSIVPLQYNIHLLDKVILATEILPTPFIFLHIVSTVSHTKNTNIYRIRLKIIWRPMGLKKGLLRGD